jgi:hypothetical protein
MRTNFLRRLGITTVLPMLFLAFGCGDKDEDDVADTIEGLIGGSGVGALSSNQLTNGYPGSLAISVYSGSTTNALHVQESESRSVKEKAQKAIEIMNGAGADCLPDILKADKGMGSPEQCYEFDSDMMYAQVVGGPNPRGYLGTHDGKSAGGEACVVSFARSEMDEIVQQVDKATGLVQMMFCQAKKSGLGSDLPAVGATFDMKSAVETAMGDKASNIAKAQMERLEDIDGRAVYLTAIEISAGSGQSTSVHLAHSPSLEGNSEYNGTLWLESEGHGGAHLQGVSDGKRLMSITYASRINDAGQEEVEYELRSADVSALISGDAFSTAGVLDFNVSTNSSLDYLKPDGSPFAQSNDAIGNITYVAFQSNLETDETTLAYWKNPGGSPTENPRGMVIASALDGAELKGCATSGAASKAGVSESGVTSIRKALKDGNIGAFAPKGFLHPFHNTTGTVVTQAATDDDGTYREVSQNGTQVKYYKPAIDGALAETFSTAQNGSIITRQCFKQNASTGAYEIDTAEISGGAGYELLDTDDGSNAGKLLAPPLLNNVAEFGKAVRPNP